jgi:hypothetical protein
MGGVVRGFLGLERFRREQRGDEQAEQHQVQTDLVWQTRVMVRWHGEPRKGENVIT